MCKNKKISYDKSEICIFAASKIQIMSKKYRFDPHKLDYTAKSKGERIVRIILTQFVAVVLLGLIVFYLLSFTLDNQVERKLKYENKILKEEYEKLLIQYQNNERNLQILEKQDEDLYKIIFKTEMPTQEYQNINLDLGGNKKRKIVKENYQRILADIDSLKATRAEFEDFIEQFKNSSSKIDSIPSIMPVPNPDMKLLVYGFGKRLDPIYKIPALHYGIDFRAPFNTPVFATADGIIQKIKRNDKVKGNYVIIKHGDYSTGYYHLEKFIVRVNQKVEKGEVIGYVGATGKSLIDHLHYEVKYKGEYVNPIFYFFSQLSPTEFYTIYKKSIETGIKLE